MAKKVSENEILNMSQDWAYDMSNGLPYSGASVQKFIKERINSKAGVFYNDSANNRYLVFADEDTRDSYLADPTQTGLILGSFDAPSNYTAVISMATPNFNAVLYGATGNYIEFMFDTFNKNDESVGEDVTCTYTIIRGGSKKVVTERYRYGTQVKFNVDKYLEEGTNTVTVGVVGNNTLAGTSVGVTYQVVNLKVSSSYDISKVYNLNVNPNAVAEIPYSVSGTGTKTGEWYLDGNQLPFESTDEVVEVAATKTKYISLASLQQGTHSVQFRAYVTVNGEKFYSDVVYMGVMVYTLADRNPLIAVAITNPSNKGIATSGLTIYGVDQYSPYTFRMAVYDPQGAAATETSVYTGNNLQGTVSIANGIPVDYTVRLSNVGATSLRIEAGVSSFVANMEVQKSSANISEITSNLLLNLSATGRSNMENSKDQWVYGDYSTAFEGFQWNSTSGWNGNRLLIADGANIEVNLAPFADRSVTASGLTIEMEFSTLNVNNENAILCDLRNASGKGLLLTASEATLTSAGDALVTTKYKSGENIRLSFVVNPATGATNKGLAFIYIDGILSGASKFAENDNFLSDTLLKIGGTIEATIALKQILVYNRTLSDDEILNNYTLYRDTNAEMMDVYDRNNIMDGRQVDLDALAAQCPVLKITGDIPTLENTTDKDETIYVDVEYTNMQNPSYSFTGTYLRMKPQGTSSMGYPKKNFRLYTAKHDDSKIFDATGKEILSRKYSFKKGSQPVDCWCFKADYAESSGTHNTGIARLWNKVMYDAQINGEYKLRTNAQKKAAENNYLYDVRTTVDGFPCHLVYRLDETSDWVYIGKYNFNNDKSTEAVFGFKDIPGFDNSKMQCWEVLNNGNHLALFEDTTNFDTEWSEAFESRYPDTKTPELADLKNFCTWVVSTKGNVEKFKTEKWDHLDVYKAAAYYVYAMRFGAVDQIVKNSMLTSEDGEHFYWINYDNDTVNGLRNDGLLVFDYLIDRNSLDPSYTDEEVFVYAGHSSTLWNNMEADEEFMAVVAEVDQALYTAGLKYSEVSDMFDNQQSGKWCERVYNQDAQYKYVGPYNDKGTNNLFMLQGARRSHRRWWLSHRFDLMDSKFISGKYKANIIDFKLMNDTPMGQKFTIRSGNLLYYGYGVNDVPAETGVRLDKGEEYTFTTIQNLNIGDPVRIYSAQNIQKLDLSQLMGRLTQLGVSGVNDAENGSQLKELILGNGTSVNSGLSEISGLDQAVSLEVLDIRGMLGMSNVNLSNIKTLKTFRAQNSGLTSFAPAEGSMLSFVFLPSTLKAMTLKSLAYLNNINIENSRKNLATIQMSNCPGLTGNATFFLNWYDNKTTEDKLCTLELDSVSWLGMDPNDLIRIGQLKKNGGLLKLKGNASITSTTQEIADQLIDIFGSNCFNPTSEFYIMAPDAIYITGPDSLLEGDKAEYTAAASSEHYGYIEWRIIEGGTTYQNIDQYGLLTTKYQNSARTITIEARHVPTQGQVAIATKRVSIIRQIRPTDGTINGDAYAANGTKYTFTPKPDGINTEYTVSWSLAGDAYDRGLVSISKQDNAGCTIAAEDGTGSFDIIASVTDCGGNVVTVTRTVELGVKVTIGINSNQENDTVVAALKATVKLITKDDAGNDVTKTYSIGNGGFVAGGAGTRVTITWPSLTGYRKPNNEDYVLVAGNNLTFNALYETEILTVNVNITDNATLDYKVSISAGNVTQTTPTGTYKIAYGTTYYIAPNAIKDYAAPKGYTFVAGELSRSVTITYTPQVISVPTISDAIDLSKRNIYGETINMTTANCYVIKSTGTYAFPLVYGNAITNGRNETPAYAKLEAQYSHDFVNHLDNVITSPFIEDHEGCIAASAEVTVADTSGIISGLNIVQGGECRYIKFNVDVIPLRGGNGIISVMDASGVIIWSWHIWLWSDSLDPVTITNKTGIDYGIMPVNLGSVWNEDTKTHIKNWYYQWGRPTPLLCPSAYNSSSEAVNYGSKTFTKQTRPANSIGEAIQNPHVFFVQTGEPYNWFGKTSYYNLWDSNCTKTGNSDNNVIKTVYDPCPVGFKMPNGRIWTGFTTTGNYTEDKTQFNVVGDFANGWYFKRNSEDTTGVFFPASGYRYSLSGGLSNVGSDGYCWCSSSYSQYNAYSLNFSSGSVNPQDSDLRAYGFSVRPALE